VVLQLNAAPVQLSLNVIFGIVTELVQSPAAVVVLIFAGQVTTGGVLSILVLYVTLAELPQPSVTVTVITAEQVPTVLAVVVNAPGQLSDEVVAAKAAASAAACVG
jgi:hypothetical protein